MGKPRYTPEHKPENILPQTHNQQLLFDAIDYNDQVVVTGPPGTGKTYISLSKAADWFASNKYHRLFICRPMVANGDDIGHLPGDISEKSQPWAAPALSVVQKRIGKGKMQCDLDQGRIQVKPLQMMQGYSLDDCWLVVDEAQEMTISQARMIVTRMGKNSKLILNGDVNQCNLSEKSGLAFLIDTIRTRSMGIPIIEFDINDCQRSEMCKKWIKVLY